MAKPRKPKRQRPFRDQLVAAANEIRARAIEKMRAAAQEGLRAARENTPGEDLPKAWTSTEKKTGRDTSGRFTSGARSGFSIKIVNTDKRMHRKIQLRSGGFTSLAKIIEYGSRAHVIQARAGSVLVFEIGGVTVKVKKVSHPGTPAYRPHARAIEAAESYLVGQGLRRRGGE